ncbi:MAG TPA: carboxylesterase family protein [Terriglobales bacterium]|nr:carboxylesterase family protein [Terriglobales bacterium]
MRASVIAIFAVIILALGAAAAKAADKNARDNNDQVKVESGTLQGAFNSDQTVRMFKGVPFAAPPVGDLRWKPPQPALNWKGVRQADKFGPACLQTNVFGDIYFRDSQPSEDCLNLNIWVSATPASAKLPVLVWFYGGGFVAGANSEPRYDGESLARKGVIVVEPNYRLGIFGFFSHPELTKESEHQASGNYGLLDEVAALQWVIRNIAAFGGDPHDITIGGESAGSLSVSALMASPLSRNLFQKALGESGAFFPDGSEGGIQERPLAESEQAGVKFGESVGAATLAQLRARPAEELLQAAAKQNRGFAFGPNLDGYFLPAEVQNIYATGEQSHVPLLAGWNADEGKMFVLFSPQKPTAKSFTEQAQERFGDQAAQFLKLYPAATDQEALASAEALAGDDFIAYSTWKWLDMQRQTGDSPVYQYHFEQVPKTKPGAMIGPVPASEVGSKHAGEIEYVFETLKSKEGVPWTEEDFKLSDEMSSYWTNFIKTGNPNGSGLPDWPESDAKDGYQLMHLSGKNLHASADTLRDRYEFLNAHVSKAQPSHGGAH